MTEMIYVHDNSIMSVQGMRTIQNKIRSKALALLFGGLFGVHVFPFRWPRPKSCLVGILTMVARAFPPRRFLNVIFGSQRRTLHFKAIPQESKLPMTFFETFPEYSLPSTVSKKAIKMIGHHARLRDVTGQKGSVMHC